MMLKVGDKVLWSGGWGTHPEKVVTIRTIEINCHGKYGEQVKEADWRLITGRECVVDFSDSPNWAYGYQIRPVCEETLMNLDTTSEGGN